ncbi:MAG TPA: ATP-binding protein [Thermoanaerobaculia bacterium]|nr:ATP-binding protein [Thermoanaerobaculia bacterium]
MESRTTPSAAEQPEGNSARALHPEEVLRVIAEGLSAAPGERLFEWLAFHLGKALSSEIAVIAELLPGGTSARSLAFVLDGVVQPEIRWDLAGTPCEEVVNRSACAWDEGVSERFPEDRYLVENGIEAYVGTPLYGSDGGVIGLISAMSRSKLRNPGLARDAVRIVSVRAAGELERLRAEERLRRSDQVHRTVLASSVEGICGMDVEGELTLVNQAAAAMLGYGVEEMIGDNFFTIVAPPEITSEFPVTARAGACAGEALFRRKGGESFPVEYVVSPMRNETGPVGWVISFLEVTQRRSLEVQLEQAHRVSSLGKLAASVAHEFNNVLMGIQPFAQIVEREGRGHAKIENAATRIHQAIQRGKRITEEILRYARPIEHVASEIELRSWLDGVASELRAVLPPAVEIRLEIGPRELWVRADESHLEQIVVNLATNAADAMPEGGRLDIAARPGTSYLDLFREGSTRYDQYVHLTFTDSGSGIQPQDLPHIFEPLFTTKTKSRGTGLGLAIVHRLVGTQGGKIFVESQPGRGSTFHVLLPAALPPQLARTAPEDELTARPRSILLVEDDPVVGAGLVELLRSEGNEVHWITEGARVEQFISDLSPELVILDLVLPDTHGSVILAGLRRKGIGVPVVISTADGDDLDAVRYENVAFLRKPYDSRALQDAMDQAARKPSGA